MKLGAKFVKSSNYRITVNMEGLKISICDLGILIFFLQFQVISSREILGKER